jgi:hypothetical protein
MLSQEDEAAGQVIGPEISHPVDLKLFTFRLAIRFSGSMLYMRALSQYNDARAAVMAPSPMMDAK